MSGESLLLLLERGDAVKYGLAIGLLAIVFAIMHSGCNSKFHVGSVYRELQQDDALDSRSCN